MKPMKPERITAFATPQSDDLSKFGEMLNKETGSKHIKVIPYTDKKESGKWIIVDGERPISQAYTKNEVVIAVAAYRAGLRTGRGG